MASVTWLDGGLATSLQAHGLPAFTPVEDWLLERPQTVLATQRAFVSAGAEILLTATFASLVRDDWARCIDRAIELGRQAKPRELWLSLGPQGDWPKAVRHAADRVDGVVLETFVDPEAAVQAVRAVRECWSGPLVGCVVVDADGKTRTGPPLREAARALIDAGSNAVGLNCMPAGAVALALDQIPRDLPIWAKPNAGPDWLDHADLLSTRCRYLGGCCGTSPQQLRALITSQP